MRTRRSIASSKIFRNLEWEEVNEILDLNIGTVKNYSKEEIVISPDEPFNYLGVILTGEMDVLRIFENGEQYQVHLLKPGNLIGIDTIAKGMDVNLFFHIAKTDMQIYLLPVSAVLKSGQIPDSIRQKMIEGILGILVHENFRQHQKVDVLSVNNLRERIYRYLSYQQFKRRTHEFEVPYNREQMADYLCVNRSALSRELSKMEKDGIIRYNRNRFEILK